MFFDAKVTEIYCMADDFAKNLLCSRKNIWLKTGNISIVTSRIG